jgi:hypothetical protein
MWRANCWQIGFFLGDVKRPSVTLPRAMSTAMFLCIVGFTSMSAALYIALPLEVIRDNNAVAIVWSTTSPFLASSNLESPTT